MAINKKTIPCIWCLLAVLGVTVSALAQDTQTQSSSGAIKALQERLKALEAEEENLKSLSEQLAAGRDVRSADLFKHWLPPALYISDESVVDDPLGIAGAAAEITQDLLDEKDVELERLRRLKSSVEGGERVALDQIESADTMGIPGREKMLSDHVADLAELRERLEAIRFQERFNRSADLSTKMAGKDSGLVIPAETGGSDAAKTEEDEEPKVAINLMTLAETCYRSGQIQKALDVFEKIDSADHDQGDRILYMIGRCKERLGDLVGARRSFNEFLRLYPESFWAPQAKFALSMVDWKQELGAIEGAPEEVTRVLTGFVENNSQEGNPTR